MRQALPMDEFSWFAGIFEGEGCLSGYASKDRPSSNRWEISIKMCDEDTVIRLGAFLGVKPQSVTRHLKANPHWSPSWQVSLRNREQLWQLGHRMYQYLSKRRQARWDDFFADMRKCKSRFENTPHSWRYEWVS